jgi:hypothetical protein
MSISDTEFAVDQYHEFSVEYSCPKCRGAVLDVTHRERSTCACDMALQDVINDFRHKETMSPWKIWVKRKP